MLDGLRCGCDTGVLLKPAAAHCALVSLGEDLGRRRWDEYELVIRVVDQHHPSLSALRMVLLPSVTLVETTRSHARERAMLTLGRSSVTRIAVVWSISHWLWHHGKAGRWCPRAWTSVVLVLFRCFHGRSCG